MNIEQLTRIVLDAAKLMNAIYRMQNRFFAFTALITPYNDLRTADFAEALKRFSPSVQKRMRP